jgi:phosphoglycolate phosphatase
MKRAAATSGFFCAMTSPFRAVILDLDGTLIETAGEIALALERALSEFGRPALAFAPVESLIGRGVRSLVERALEGTRGDPVDLDRAVERFEHHYAATVGTTATLYPGVLAGLRTMREARISLAVVTNKPRAFTLRLLDRLEVTEFFGSIVAGDDGVRRKPHGDMLLAACEAMQVAPASTVMIGDSENDVLAARAAGCVVWCVPYGYNEGRGSQTLACDRVVATIEEAAHLLVVPAPDKDARGQAPSGTQAGFPPTRE